MPNRPLSADDVEQAGRMLMPAFCERVDEAVDRLEKRLGEKFDSRLEVLEKEVARHKGLLGKAMWIGGIFNAAVGIAWGTAWGMVSEKFKSKFGSH